MIILAPAAIVHGLQSTINDVNVLLYFSGLYKTGLACYCLPLNLKQGLDAHVGTLPQALVTRLVLRLRALDKDLRVDDSSNFLCISYYANIR